MQLLDGQKASENPSAMGARDPIEVDAPPGNEKSSGKDEIAAEIEQLKKKQKKVQMRTKLHCLRKHKAQGFVEDVPEQESNAQRLALEKAKKVCDPNVYLGENQCTLDKYVSQVDFIFQTKSLMYASKEAKCFYTVAFLSGIS